MPKIRPCAACTAFLLIFVYITHYLLIYTTQLKRQTSDSFDSGYLAGSVGSTGRFCRFCQFCRFCLPRDLRNVEILLQMQRIYGKMGFVCGIHCVAHPAANLVTPPAAQIFKKGEDFHHTIHILSAIATDNCNNCGFMLTSHSP
jgi:hypothetical protein